MGQFAPNDRVYNSADPEDVWTTEKEDAARDAIGYPAPTTRRGTSGTAGQPSKINHGNIAPSVDESLGGATISQAVQTAVLSYPALRKLGFPGYAPEQEDAERATLARGARHSRARLRRGRGL